MMLISHLALVPGNLTTQAPMWRCLVVGIQPGIISMIIVQVAERAERRTGRRHYNTHWSSGFQVVPDSFLLLGLVQVEPSNQIKVLARGQLPTCYQETNSGCTSTDLGYAVSFMVRWQCRQDMHGFLDAVCKLGIVISFMPILVLSKLVLGTSEMKQGHI